MKHQAKEIWLTQRCHGKAALGARVFQETPKSPAALELVCAECGKHVVTITGQEHMEEILRNARCACCEGQK